MVCGVYLGLLLMCLVQAEHARCSRLTEAPSDGSVGSPQQERGVRVLYGLVPQNPLRQPLVSTGWARSRAVGSVSPGSLWSSSASNRRDVFDAQQAPLLKVPATMFREPSLNNYNEDFLSGADKLWLVQQPRGFLLGRAASSPSVSMETRLFTAAPRADASGRSRSDSSPRRVNADASAERQSLACGVGRRVSAHRHSGSPEPFRFRSLQNKRPRTHLSPSKPQQSYLFAAGAGRSEPPPTAALGCERYARGSSYRSMIPPESLQDPGRSGATSGRMSGSGSSGQTGPSRLYAPTRTLTVPRHLGDNGIRRLKAPDEHYVNVPRAPRQPVRWLRVKMRH